MIENKRLRDDNNVSDILISLPSCDLDDQLAKTDLLLIEDLHGVMLSRFSVLHQHNAAKRARTQGFQPLKLLQASSVLNI